MTEVPEAVRDEILRVVQYRVCRYAAELHEVGVPDTPDEAAAFRAHSAQLRHNLELLQRLEAGSWLMAADDLTDLAEEASGSVAYWLSEKTMDSAEDFREVARIAGIGQALCELSTVEAVAA